MQNLQYMYNISYHITKSMSIKTSPCLLQCHLSVIIVSSATHTVELREGIHTSGLKSEFVLIQKVNLTD